jgi:Uma2 family endonuclease
MKEPPLCAIEILSPTQAIPDLVAKASNYFSHGVQSCWIVIPSFQNIYVYSSAMDYEIYKKNQILQDIALGIELPVVGVFS